jgi:uncharacterized protein (DUF362 family)
MLGVAKGKDYRLLVIKAIEIVGGIGAFVKTGDTVVIKPNMGWDRTPEQGANTHPLVVRALADLATVIEPKLTLIDATRILLRNGPQGGWRM